MPLMPLLAPRGGRGNRGKSPLFVPLPAPKTYTLGAIGATGCGRGGQCLKTVKEDAHEAGAGKVLSHGG